MHKNLILASLLTLVLTGCNQDSNQANILNTTSALTPQNYNITIPAPQNSPVIADDATLADEKKSLINTMLQTVKKLETNATTEDVEKLARDQQKLIMTDPYETEWQQKMETLNNQLIQLEVIVQDHKAGLTQILEQIRATLQNL